MESYAYNAVAYAFNLPEVINAIRMVNEDAVIVVVGMYNPMDGAVIDLGDGTVLDISEYLDYLVEAAELHGVLTAMCTGSAIYVEAPDVATDVPAVISLMDLIRGKVDFTPNDEGHEYIKDQILKALTVTKEEVTGLLGDADGDGDVDNVDAMFILRYSVHAIGADRLNLAVCDVNGDGAVDNVDAMFVLRYSVHSIDRFPASK